MPTTQDWKTVYVLTVGMSPIVGSGVDAKEDRAGEAEAPEADALTADDWIFSSSGRIPAPKAKQASACT